MCYVFQKSICETADVANESSAQSNSHTLARKEIKTPHGIFRSMPLPLFPLITVWWLINSFPAGASLTILIVMITCLFAAPFYKVKIVLYAARFQVSNCGVN